MKPLSVVKGLLTFIPGVEPLLRSRRTGGTSSASYSYDVWMKHTTLLWAQGMHTLPDGVAELGPGDSIGIGLAAILAGASCYCGLDVVRYSNVGANLAIFDELVGLFRARAPRPIVGWPDYAPYLDERLFPSHILSDEMLASTLSEKRIRAIRAAIADPGSTHDGIRIRYVVPWSDADIVERESVDLVLSHSVLEHVVDLESTYRALEQWLKPGGRMSHQIDFDSHNLARHWNGHRAYAEWFWRMSMGKRVYSINREPCSTHRTLIESSGLRLTNCLHRPRTDGMDRTALAPRWRNISDHDLNCCSLFVQAQKTP